MTYNSAQITSSAGNHFKFIVSMNNFIISNCRTVVANSMNPVCLLLTSWTPTQSKRRSFPPADRLFSRNANGTLSNSFEQQVLHIRVTVVAPRESKYYNHFSSILKTVVL